MGVDGYDKYEALDHSTLDGYATYGANNGENGTSDLTFTKALYLDRSLLQSVSIGTIFLLYL